MLKVNSVADFSKKLKSMGGKEVLPPGPPVHRGEIIGIAEEVPLLTSPLRAIANFIGPAEVVRGIGQTTG